METTSVKKKDAVLSGIQPTSVLTIGNYFGALKNYVAMQDDFDAYYMVANLHAQTVKMDPTDLRRRSIETYALFLSLRNRPEPLDDLRPEPCTGAHDAHLGAHVQRLHGRAFAHDAV